jgi:ABC-type multidrug transport system fused ATPase/permease subunit
LKRLYSISKSPVFSHFSETVAGAQCIRAYGEQKRFIAKSEYLVDTNNKSLYLNFVANRWLGVRIENLGNCITLFAAIFAIVNRDNLTAGEAGLSISYSLNIFSVLTW